ncbi:acyl-CoA N-acyltransferase [Bombardia bombarda]|uniref:Histone acetyltransferase type B catalytic subunit n=1 Tax=Bombardia bombarda TaxID=252184 RepID=A0AA40C9V9_9PEZI|nr:acyl-CoA N-acyltransferase [Bombardia bombarda]
MSADDAWSANANDALTLSLVTPSSTGLKTLTTFHPKFTHTVFGDDEQVFGYQNLQINVQYHASDMRPHLDVFYSKKFKAVGETEAVDIKKILSDYLPEVAFQKKKDYEDALKRVRDDWTPPGELAATFTKRGATYEVWKGNLEDPSIKQLVRRIQFFVPLFVEGGQYIQIDEPEAERWTIYFLYQKKPVPGEAERFSYTFAGYSTVYRFFLFQAPPTPPQSPSDKTTDPTSLLNGSFDLAELPCRSRISQLIVIRPFQNKGLGPKLYGIVFQEYLKHAPTVEITVEDPNEAFDDMRDIADLHFLRTLPAFNALRINTSLTIPYNGVAPNNIVDKAASEAVRRQAKIAPRQFARVLEMHLMSQLAEAVQPGISPEKSATRAKKEEAHQYRLWRLIAKKRLYQHNKDLLGQLELKDRVEKLNETLSGVEFDYARLLIKAETQLKQAREDEESAGGRKRKSEDDKDKEGEGESARKKAKVRSE